MISLIFYILGLVPVFKGSSSVQASQTNSSIPMINVTVTNSTCMVLGIITLLKQFNPEYRNQFIGILSQYIRSSIGNFNIQRSSDLPVDVPRILSFLEDFVELNEIDRQVSESNQEYVMELILNLYFLFI